ncbi:MAG: hypothetical protein HC858_05055 [Brachymonas sp.]|nr:hypothetical protein [Brachymonas sp.]
MQLKQGLLQASSAVGALHPQRFFMRKSSMHIKIIGWAMAISMSGFALAQVKSIQAVPDSTVLEKLGPRLRPPVASADLIPAIRQAISLARQQADPRYLGQAQALIGQRWANRMRAMICSPCKPPLNKAVTSLRKLAKLCNWL